MTKKDFIALANSLRLLKADLDHASADGCDNSIDLAFHAHVEWLATHFAHSSPRFDRNKFKALAYAKHT